MHVLAYCCKSFRRSVRRAAGVEPLLSPPASIETITPTTLEGYDLIYFKLHGLPNQAYWYGDNWVTALSAAQVHAADLSKTVVFAANCHLTGSPMLEALQQAGALAVIGGPGKNYALRRRFSGTDLLGLIFRRALGITHNPDFALTLAKARLRLCKQDKVIRDTLEFQLFT